MAFSKLNEKCTATAMYKNSLILRITMTEKPFVHKKLIQTAKAILCFMRI